MRIKACLNTPAFLNVGFKQLTSSSYWVVFTMIFLACGERQISDIAPIDSSQYAYFPLKIGKFVVCQVDSIVYDFDAGGNTVQDSSRTFSKKLWLTHYDSSGELQYIIERYEQTDLSQPWVFKMQLHQARQRLNLSALKTIGGFKVGVSNGPSQRMGWNIWIDESREIEIAGERMRPFTNWAYKVDSIDVQAIVGQFSFDSTLLVTEADDTNVIERRL
ncbi:MAG: hypothetical protein IPH31_05450 [Lewinellaceae bacterium]|nr:hypothetical protein [Lewinellaceae bacterium]